MQTSDFQLNLAVVIGINHYQNGIPKLRTARQDAEAIAEVLQTNYHYQVTLLTDNSATRQNLQQWFETDLPAAIAKTSPSRLLFYFAGHGIALNGDEGPQGYLIPQDAKLGDVSTYLPMQQVEAALSKLACRHCLVILDCCFAGAFRWSSTRKLVPITETIYKERYDRFIQDPAWQVITSAASDQYALDNLELSSDRGIAPQKSQHSPFAAALIDALQGSADLPRPGQPAGDGIITATELYLYLRDAVEIPTDERNQRQTPQIWCLKQHDKGEFIFLPPGHPLNLPPAPSIDELETNNPYRGLKSYDIKDSALFFGRTALIEKLRDAVCDRAFTVVLGASGSGKSSLVKAGLIPHLDRSWTILPPIRPGESPLESLNKLSIGPRTKQLLVIDQFEELITLCRQEEERQQFLEQLTTLVNSQIVHLVVTLRSDFEPQFRSTPLESHWQAARFVVPAMTRDELQSVIEEPASAKVVYFESSSDRGYLVDRLIDEVAGMPGALPLLSFTLSELYLKLARRYQAAQKTGDTVERSLTWADYDELGGATQSLTRRADEIYDALVSRDRAYEKTIRQVMLRLVAVGGEVARRQVPEAELQYPEPENTRVHTVIDQFASARLLVSGTDAKNTPYIEPAHDALVRGWERLLTWKTEAEETLILQRRLTPAAVEWKEVRRKNNAQPKSMIEKVAPLGYWIDRQLFQVETVLNRIPTRLSQAKRTQEKPTQFLWDSNPYLSVLDQELQSQDHSFNQLESEFVRESVLLKRRTTSWRWRTAIAIILGLSGLSIAALIGQRSALISQTQASRESAEANFQAGQSLNAAIESLKAAGSLKHPLLQLFKPNVELQQQVEGTLQKAVYAVPERNRVSEHQGVTRIQSSADGRLVIMAGEDGNVSLWNGQGQKQAAWNTGQGAIMNLAFSPDTQKIATAGADGTARLWTLHGQALAVFRGHSGMLKGISFSPDSQKLATSGVDKTVRLWNLQGKPLSVLTGHQGHVWNIAFSPNGQVLASASDDDTFRLWNLQSQQSQTIKTDQGELHAIDFSPDGQRLATAGKDGHVRLWTAQGQPLASLPGHQGRIWRLKFSADGQYLASASGDSSVRVWTATGQLVTVLRGHQGPARHVSFGANSRQLVSSGDDATARFWTIPGQAIATLKGHQGSVRSVQFSSNGQQIATGGEDSTIRLWNVQGQNLSIARSKSGAVRAIAFSSHSQYLASTQGQTLQLWNGSNPMRVEFKGHQGLVRSVQFSPNGQQLVSSGDDGFVRLWNLQGQSLAGWQADQKRVWQVVFSPNGQQLASVGDEGVVRLWNLKGQLLNTFIGHLGSIYSVSFNPKGKELASAGQDGTVRLWDLQDSRKSRLFETHEAEINSVAFSPDGQRFVSGDTLGHVQLWNLQLPQQVSTWIAHPGSIVRQVSFSADGRSVATAADDGTAKVWQLDTFDQLRARNCNLIRDYLEYLKRSQKESESNRAVCDDVQ